MPLIRVLFPHPVVPIKMMYLCSRIGYDDVDWPISKRRTSFGPNLFSVQQVDVGFSLFHELTATNSLLRKILVSSLFVGSLSFVDDAGTNVLFTIFDGVSTSRLVVAGRSVESTSTMQRSRLSPISASGFTRRGAFEIALAVLNEEFSFKIESKSCTSPNDEISPESCSMGSTGYFCLKFSVRVDFVQFDGIRLGKCIWCSRTMGLD